jgi:hypothetical protein
MILDNEPMFDNCLIKPNKKYDEPVAAHTEINHSDQETDTIVTLEKDGVVEVSSVENIPATDSSTTDSSTSTVSATVAIETMVDELPPTEAHVLPIASEGGENIALELEFEDLTEDIEENSNELKEINSLELSVGDTLETIQLKKPNQVYFEIYKAARNKAKIAKKNALLAYLEAKNIKKTYMLENLNDSDSDIDAEIDEVSESELDGL